MEQLIKQPKWKKVEFSRSAIIKAGSTIKNDSATEEELIKAREVIDNWRAAHAFPLHVIYIHLRKLAQNDPNILVAERIKRLDSIIAKLKREPTMSLWYMQDLGGCRFIVDSISDVYRYFELYDKSRKRHIHKSTNDYIKTPKKSGYRSLHVVYQYYSDKNEDYNKNMQIEIQFRTHLQHLWATAVETVGLFTRQAIKSGQGTERVKRFFELVSSLFAIREKMPIVPDTPSTIKDLVAEIKGIDKKENIIGLLRSIKVVTYATAESKHKTTGYCLMVLNFNTYRLKMFYFSTSNIDKANELYSNIENAKTESNIDAVLVRVDSIQALRRAYPNYFSDIGEFVNIIQSYIKNFN